MGGVAIRAATSKSLATVVPLRIPLTGWADSQRERFLQTAAASRHYARNLLVDTASEVVPTRSYRAYLELAASQLTGSMGEVIGHLNDSKPTPRVYVRAAALFDVAAAQLDDGNHLAPSQLALRDLQLLDGTIATLAHSLGLSVQALDTSNTSEPAPRPQPHQ